MKIYDACVIAFKDINDEPIRQTEIVNKVVELTGYSYESCRANVFRSTRLVPFVHTDFKKVLDNNGYVSYVRGDNEFRQNYSKPNEYYNLLQSFNRYDNIYTLSGTESNCMKVLDSNKTTKVDNNKLIEDVLHCDIFKIKHDNNSAFNLDFEGILTINKVNKINKMKCSEILLTLRVSKNTNYLLSNINSYKITESHTYKSGRDNMMICKLIKK